MLLIHYLYFFILLVGYGEFYAKTQPGRIIVVILCIIGKVWVSLFTVILTNEMTFTGGASKSFDMLMQLEYREELTICSNEILFNSSKMLIFLKKFRSNPENTSLKKEIDSMRTHLKRNILEFSLLNM